MVMALAQRDGNMGTRVMRRVINDNLRRALEEMVDHKARIKTDEHQGTRSSDRCSMPTKRSAIAPGEYAGGNVHCNTAESFIALLKRGIHRSFLHVGKGQLRRYSDEFSFRRNHRKTTDAKHTEAALKRALECKLQCREKRKSLRGLKLPRTKALD